MIEQIKEALANAEKAGPSLTHQDWIKYLLDELEKAQKLQETLKEALSAVIGEGRKDKLKADEWTNAVIGEARQLRTDHTVMKEALEAAHYHLNRERYMTADDVISECLANLSQPKEESE